MPCSRSLSLAALAALVLTSGCRVEDHKDANHNDDVNVSTPFGGMSVKTNDNVAASSTGLTPYPGATIVKKDKDNGAADVNMNFGSFHLGVKAVSYRTADAPDKVLAFYRRDMAHFGEVVLCHGSHAVGQPDHTQDGLTCDSSHGGSVHVSDDNPDQELKAGSKSHQHVVAISEDGSGTRIGLIALDLPEHLDSNGKESQ